MEVILEFGSESAVVEIQEHSLPALRRTVCEVFKGLAVGGFDLKHRGAVCDDALELAGGDVVEVVPSVAVQARGRLEAKGLPVNGDMLLAASHCGQLELCRLLLEAGISPDSSDSDHRTGLMLAAKGGHIAVCRLLLNHGADVNLHDDSALTCLTLSRWSGRREVTSLLLQHGAVDDVMSPMMKPLSTPAWMLLACPAEHV